MEVRHTGVVAGWAFLLGVWATVGVGALVDGWDAVPYVSLTPEERDSGTLMKEVLHPNVIRLVIDDPKNIEAVRPNAYAYAYAYASRRPCEVHIPAGVVIEYHPAGAWAAWGQRHYGDTIAHELLHCQRGAWHPE